MRSEALVEAIEGYFGLDAVLVEEDGARRWHSVVWFATPTGIPVFGVTIFSGDGINWRVGGTQGMPDKAMREIAQLHEVISVPEKCEEGCETVQEQCGAQEGVDVRRDMCG